MTGSICPLAKTDGLFFDSKMEPQNQEFELMQEIGEREEQEGMLVVHIGGKDAVKYYDAKYKLMKEIQGLKSKREFNDNMLHILINQGDDSNSFI